MKRVNVIAAAVMIAVLALVAGKVAAQETNTSERTFLTFSNTVEMPGLTLPAGTYVFKLADTASRNVVQVWDRDEKNMLGHWLFVQAERPEVTSENVVMFKEAREGTTPAVQFWYFPGEKIGKEFIYPKDQAQKIALRTGIGVRSDDGVVEGGGIAAVENDNAAVAVDTTLENAPAAAQPTAAGGSLAGNRGVAPEPDIDADADRQVAQAENDQQQDQPAAEPARPIGTSGQAEGQVARAEELPRTASPLPLTGLMGLLSLVSAAGVRAFRK